MASPSDFFVQPGNDAGQALSGLSGTLGNMRAEKARQAERQQLIDAQNEKEQRIQDRFNAARTAAQAALQSGNPDEMAKVAIDFPEVGQGLSQAFGLVDDAKKKDAANFTRELLTSPDRATEIYQNRIKMLEDSGRDATDTKRSFAAYQQNPQAESKNLQYMYAAIDKDGYGAMRDEQKEAAKAAADQAKIDREEDHFNRSEEGKNNRAAMSAGDRALTRQIAVLTAQQNAEMNGLKRQEIQQKLEDTTRKRDENVAKQQQAAESTVATFDQAIGSADRLLNHPALKQTFGPVGRSSAIPTLPGGASADFEAELDTLKAQTFLPQVAALKGAGALSDAEGKKLSDSIGALSTKMSQPAFEASLARVKETLTKAKERAAKKAPAGIQASPGAGSGNAGVPADIQDLLNKY